MDRKFDYDLLVIGCGPAGQRAAVQAAKLKKKVGIIDRREVVGGICVNVGTIPSKSFKEAVLFLTGYRQRTMYGAEYRFKNDIRMADLTFRCNRIMTTEISVINEQLARNHVDVFNGHCKFIGDNAIEINSISGRATKTAERFVIATGTVPNRPPNVQFNGTSIFDSDDILTVSDLPRELTVVGAGIIGTEYASMFATLGTHVTLIDARKQLLDIVDTQIVDSMQSQLKVAGMDLCLGEEVESCLVREDKKVVVKLKSGKILISDCVLFSAGRKSATSDLGLEHLGIITDERGRIPVNSDFQTIRPHIYAAGDVIGFPALASTSAAQGRQASCHAFGVRDEVKHLPVPFGIYSIPEVSFVGLNEKELTSRNIPFETGIAKYREIARGLIIGDEHGMLKLLFHPESREILGVHIIGELATELIHIGQSVMALKGGLDYLRDIVFNYPTLAECYKVAALDGYNKLKQRSQPPPQDLC